MSVILGEEIVVNADCMNQESSPPYRVQIRIAPVHPRIGVVDGGRRHLVVILRFVLLVGIGLLLCVFHLEGVDVYLNVLCHGLKFFENRVSTNTNC